MLLHSTSAAEVKVILKNGRVIVADSCRNVKDNLICEKLGGTFEFALKDMLDVKEMTLQRDNVRINSADESGYLAKPQEGVFKGADSEREKRLEQITQRKTELKAEREALLREREDLQQEVNESNDRMAKRSLNTVQQRSGIALQQSLRQRSADLYSRIEKFGSELKSLNEEEAGLLGSRQQTP